MVALLRLHWLSKRWVYMSQLLGGLRLFLRLKWASYWVPTPCTCYQDWVLRRVYEMYDRKRKTLNVKNKHPENQFASATLSPDAECIWCSLYLHALRLDLLECFVKNLDCTKIQLGQCAEVKGDDEGRFWARKKKPKGMRGEFSAGAAGIHSIVRGEIF